MPVGRAETVALPPLPSGAHVFPRLADGQDVPPDLRWDSPAYESVQPWLLTFEDALVHSEAGIVCLGDAVVSDTLQQTAPEQQGYVDAGEDIVLPGDDAGRLAGAWLNLLGGNYRNYYHWTLDGLGRLATGAGDAPGVLAPAGLDTVRQDGLARAGALRGRALRAVGAETILVERLVTPWTMTGFHRPHPALRPFFARLRDAAPAPPGPPRLYIDRRPADRRPGAHRRLVNEDAVAAALAPLGFVPVQLERLSLAGQVGLFAGAEAIVAPHGAGLANLVYARPGCALVELHMDAWRTWCFRTLSAAMGLRYDALAGRQTGFDGPTRLWQAPETHVAAAAAQALGG